MAEVIARKNIETDNPKLKGGVIWCMVKKWHIMEEYLHLYEDKHDDKRVKIEHRRKPDDFIPTPISFNEAYSLYLEGYVIPAKNQRDPRPREELRPYLTPKQKEAASYLEKMRNGEEVATPSFIKEWAVKEAGARTNRKRAALKVEPKGAESEGGN